MKSLRSGNLPGPGQPGPISRKPAGAVDHGGWIEPIFKRVALVKVNTSGTTRTSASVAARIENPAARLVCGFSVAFEPVQSQAFSNFNSAVWTAQAIRPANEGREAQLHNLFSAQNLPQLYEVSSAVRVIHVTATLTIPLTAGAAAIEGTWLLEATWEPAMPMCSDEVAALYARCTARIALNPAGPLAP